MDWQGRLRSEGLLKAFDDHTQVYHLTFRPAIPPEYDLPGIVAVTFRLGPRPRGGHVYATTIDVAAAVRLGARMGLDAGEAIAMVDSHERVHIALQVAGAPEEREEAWSIFVDAVLLSFRHPAIARHLRAGAFGLVTRVEPGFWEALIDLGEKPPRP